MSFVEGLLYCVMGDFQTVLYVSTLYIINFCYRYRDHLHYVIDYV